MTGAKRNVRPDSTLPGFRGRVTVPTDFTCIRATPGPASVLMVVTPYYEPLTLDETLQYLRTVASAVDIPIMLYNLPGATGVNLAPTTVGQLAREVENIRYIKDTSADMAQAGQLIHHYGDVISTFVGWDSLLLAALTEGAAGVMAGTANVMPAQLVSIHRALLAG